MVKVIEKTYSIESGAIAISSDNNWALELVMSQVPMSTSARNRDMVLATQAKLCEVKATIRPVRVKGHSDTPGFYRPPTLLEYLNIEMDILAKEKWNCLRCGDAYQGHIEGKDRSFWVNGRKLDGNIY